MFEPKSFKERQLTLIKSIFDSNECISEWPRRSSSPCVINSFFICVGFDTIESLYTFTSPIDLINDNYDKDSFVRLNSCVIKSTVKDACKANFESISEYYDVNVSWEMD